MPYRFLHDLEGLKMIAAGVVAFGSVLADATKDDGSWESLTLKGALLAAVIYLARELKVQGDRHRAELVARQMVDKKEAEDRDTRMMETLKANSIAKAANTRAMQEVRMAMDQLKSATDQQTEYYKTVARTLLNRQIQPRLPKED